MVIDTAPEIPGKQREEDQTLKSTLSVQGGPESTKGGGGKMKGGCMWRSLE